MAGFFSSRALFVTPSLLLVLPAVPSSLLMILFSCFKCVMVFGPECGCIDIAEQHFEEVLASSRAESLFAGCTTGRFGLIVPY